MPVVWDDATRALFDGRNFPVVATVSPDGEPHSSVVWMKRDGDALLFVTARHKPKGRNLAHTPRISVSCYDRDDPYQAVEVRGHVELLDDDPDELLDELAVTYTGQPRQSRGGGKELVVVRVVPEKIVPYRG